MNQNQTFSKPESAEQPSGEGLQSTVLLAFLRIMQHEYYDRDDGLAHCKICGGAEGALATECPGYRMTESEEDSIYAGKIDFLDGKWVSARQPSLANAPDQATAREERR